MNRVARLAGLGFVVAVATAVLAATCVWMATEPMIRRTYQAPLQSIAVPTDEIAIAEGRRLARLHGCLDGCHGHGVAGYDFELDPWDGTMIAPELTQVLATHTDSELERVIRRGVRRNGESTWGMPSSMFYHLTDADLGRIIAFLRSLPPGDGPATRIRVGPGWRLDLLHDRYLPMVEEIRRHAPWLTPEDRQGEHGRGRYLVLTVCTECHGMDLGGAPDGSAPNLLVVAGYSEDQFAHLMKTGEPIGDRQLDLMARVARTRFSNFTAEEVRAVYGYLSARVQDVP